MLHGHDSAPAGKFGFFRQRVSVVRKISLPVVEAVSFFRQGDFDFAEFSVEQFVLRAVRKRVVVRALLVRRTNRFLDGICVVKSFAARPDRKLSQRVALGLFIRQSLQPLRYATIGRQDFSVQEEFTVPGIAARSADRYPGARAAPPQASNIHGIDSNLSLSQQIGCALDFANVTATIERAGRTRIRHQGNRK